jgi:hypothetical protein
MADSDIFLRFGADIEPLKKGAKEASNQIKGLGKDTVELGKQMAALTVAATATATAVVAVASNSAQSAREIRSLAMVSGLGVKQFQDLAFAANTVGIEQDKLADIFKDTQDKIGDFIATGAGPMADFFENIGPKVGVMADDFKSLSGPEALGLYVASLEKANLSQSEMVFYMEAIASDATNLLPLLRNNSAEFQNLAKQSQDLNIALSETDIATLDRMQVSLDKAAKTSEGFINKLGVEFAPIIEHLVSQVGGMGDEFGTLDEVIQDTFNGAIKAAGFLSNAYRGIEIAIKTLEIGFHTIMTGALSLGGIFSDEIKKAADGAAQATKDSVNELNELLLAPLPSETVEAYVANIKSINDQVVQAEIEKNDQIREINLQAQGERLDQERTFAESMSAIRASWTDSETTAVAKMFGDLSSLMQTENKRLFEIGKVAARANTIVSTYSAAQKAYESLAGIPVVGPALGAAAAGAAIVAGGVRLQAINSTSFGSGSVNSGASAGGADASGGAAAASAPQPSAPAQTLRVDTLDPNALVTGDTFNALVGKLVEFQEDGGRLVV